MTRLTVNKTAEAITPSEQLIAKAAESKTICDANGRNITLRKPGMLAQFRLVEMLGESAKNQVYLGMVTPLLYVVAVDGDEIRPPAKKSELEALIQRLEEAGVEAVHTEVMAQAEASASPEATKAAIKN